MSWVLVVISEQACRVPLLLDGIISGRFNGQTTAAIKRETLAELQMQSCGR